MDLVERLAAHKAVGRAPREELEWLVAHGSLRHLAPGEVLSTKGEPVTGLFIVLTGHVAIFLDRGAGRHKLMEWRGGDVAGVLPYSRMVSPPGHSVAQEPTEILAIPREDLPAMIRDCHEAHLAPRPQDARSQPRVRVERPAGREDAVARQAVRRTRARAEQPGLRHRTQRLAARRAAGRRRTGGARDERGGTDRSAARRDRHAARVVRRPRRERGCERERKRGREWKRKCQRKRKRAGRIVEFALVSLVLYLLLAGTIEFGRLMFDANALQDVARVAARELAVAPVRAEATFEYALACDAASDVDCLADLKARIFDPACLVVDFDDSCRGVRS